jgi:hypothetical protein
MWGWALAGKTTEISADASGLRKSSAFGWRQIRSDQVGGVQEQHQTVRRTGQGLFRPAETWHYTKIVFADRGGRRLISLSPEMGPAPALQRLLDLCAKRTGQRMERRELRTDLY